ncbi:MAG TPA: hypothetical protein VF147_03385 [Vicinamibacterales bacterium]
MSTCPRCRQYLGEGHRCPRAIRWRRPAIQVLLAAVGAIVAFLVGSLIGPPFDIIFAPFGAFAGYKVAPRRRKRRGRSEPTIEREPPASRSSAP